MTNREMLAAGNLKDGFAVQIGIVHPKVANCPCLENFGKTLKTSQNPIKPQNLRNTQEHPRKILEIP